MKKRKEKYDYEAIISDKNNGLCNAEIIKKHTIPKGTLRSFFFKQRQIHKRNLSIDTMDKINILKLRGNKKTFIEIANILNLEEEKVNNFLVAFKKKGQLFLEKQSPYNSKNFNPATVRLIRKAYPNGGKSLKELSVLYNCSLQSIYSIACFETYKHVK